MEKMQFENVKSFINVFNAKLNDFSIDDKENVKVNLCMDHYPDRLAFCDFFDDYSIADLITLDNCAKNNDVYMGIRILGESFVDGSVYSTYIDIDLKYDHISKEVSIDSEISAVPELMIRRFTYKIEDLRGIFSWRDFLRKCGQNFFTQYFSDDDYPELYDYYDD